MRERMRWLVVALAAVMVVAVVGTAPASKDTLVIGMPTDVPIFDTHKATGLHNGSILNQVSEPLVRLTSDGKVVPWLVESWEQSRDGKTWTLHTRRASSSPTARRSTPRRCGSISSASASTRSARPRWRWSSRWR
jgi:ABC-type transport system substrate-binding protein